MPKPPPLSTLITKTVDDLVSRSIVDNSLLPMGWFDQHGMPRLLGQLKKALGGCASTNCPVVATSEVGKIGVGQNLLANILQVAAASAGQCLLAKISSGDVFDRDYCSLLLGLAVVKFTGKVEIQNVIAKTKNAIDPGPGWLYSLEVGSGSAPIESITLPVFGDVFGWALRLHDSSGWTDDNIRMLEAAFVFPNDVDAFTFMPLGQDGRPIFNPESFVYDLVFSKSGTFSAFQANYGGLTLVLEIPEPGTLYLILVGALTLLLAVVHPRILDQAGVAFSAAASRRRAAGPGDAAELSAALA